MFEENIVLEFPVTVYGNLEKYNETISVAVLIKNAATSF